MFASVDLFAGDDVVALSAVNVVFVQRAESVRMQQPCAALSGCSCSVYELRPAVCREYECNLLKGYRRGELTLERARAVIECAVTLSRDVRPRLEALVAAPTGLQDLARLAGLAAGPRAVNRMDRRSFPLLLAEVQADLANSTDGAARREEHAQLLADANALYDLLVGSFGPGPGQSPQES